MGLATFSLAGYPVGFEVSEQGQPQVAFGGWSGDGETEEVEHLLTLSEDHLMSLAIRGAGLPVVIRENGHQVRMTADDLRHLRMMFTAAKSMLESYQAWLTEHAQCGCTVPDRRWELLPA